MRSCTVTTRRTAACVLPRPDALYTIVDIAVGVDAVCRGVQSARQDIEPRLASCFFAVIEEVGWIQPLQKKNEENELRSEENEALSGQRV